MNNELKVDASSISTRKRAKEIVNKAHKKGYTAINLSDVEFISRSVADEFVHHKKDSGIELRGQHGAVAEMICAIDNSRSVTAK